MAFNMNIALTLASLLASSTLTSAASSAGTTTRYWDCCKPSCAWKENVKTTGVVASCSKDDSRLTDASVASGCDGGGSFMCSTQAPWAINGNLAYGFAAVTAANPACCDCFELTFTSGSIKDKKMIVQATNTGMDVKEGAFDIAMPGGGFGIFDGCTPQYGLSSDVWGERYGGLASDTCSAIPSSLQKGCSFRFDWFQNADNPTVNYAPIACPAELVAKSGCGVAGDTTTAANTLAASSPSAPATEGKAAADASTPAKDDSTTPPLSGGTIEANGTDSSTTTPTNEEEKASPAFPSSFVTSASAPPPAATSSPSVSPAGGERAGSKMEWNAKSTTGKHRYQPRPGEADADAAGMEKEEDCEIE